MNHIKEIKKWFELAVPEPTPETRAVQYGCHLEEIAEGLEATGDFDEAFSISDLADKYKGKDLTYVAGLHEGTDSLALLDALCDKIVTAIGVAHMFGFDIAGALAEVNRSNFSKFVDGKPVFNAQGKIAKPESYSPPDLTPFLGE